MNGRVLLVEDDASVREALAQTLELAELEPIQAGSFVAAKDRITRVRKPDPKKREYWVFHGIDQFCHQVTLVGVVAGLLWFG